MIYLLLKLGFGIVAGIITSIVVVIAGIVGLIVGLLFMVPGAFIAKAIPLFQPLLIGMGVGVLFVGILALVILVGLVTLPIPIFFKAFALTYLVRLIPEYNLLKFFPPSSDGT